MRRLIMVDSFPLIQVDVNIRQSENPASVDGVKATVGASPLSGALNLPWQDELCCDSPLTHLDKGGNASSPKTNRSATNLPHHSHCNFRNFTTKSQLSPKVPGGSCLKLLCRIDENWTYLACDLQSDSQPPGKPDSGRLAVRLQRLSEENNTEVNESDNPVVCEGKDSFTCSFSLKPTGFVAMVTVSISNEVAPPVLLIIPSRPVKPSPPVNMSDFVTTRPELIVQWEDPPDYNTGQLRYEVQYSSSTNNTVWQVVPSPGKRNLSLDLQPYLIYTIQVRCSGLAEPPLWSEWSKPHRLYLDTVSLIPKKVVVRPGDNVTVYCVFNDHSRNASSAVWTQNKRLLPSSHFRPYNQRVSQITVRASGDRMYDTLRCVPDWQQPYSRIFVDEPFVDIQCVTNGNKTAIDCNWEKWDYPPSENLTFQSKGSNLPCEEMEKRERFGGNAGVTGPSCVNVISDYRKCQIQLVKNCFKLWLTMQSRSITIRSKPIYLAPEHHVKPNKPSVVSAVSRSTRVLKVTWNLVPRLVEGVKCQLRYHLLPTMWEEWKVLSPVEDHWAEVKIPDMCGVYVVQVRCMPKNGIGHWSEWSSSKRSTPQNSRVPECGPDFWRIRRDDPHRNQSNITLLFQDIPVSGNLYCVDGLIVQHQSSSGNVQMKKIHRRSSYSFKWDQDSQTVTVKTYNSLGSSFNNINMTLEKQTKRRCLHSFHGSIINSTCVYLSWSLLDKRSVPLSMVVEWSPQRPQDSLDAGPSEPKWARLPYTDRPVHLRGDFFSSEYSFYLYPVFADGEGEPMSTLVTRSAPAAYMMLTLISFLCIALIVTLILTQNRIKKLVWKAVPNPNRCSWAKGLDFKKVDTLDHLFKPPEGLLAWPLKSENISKVIIMDQALTKALMHSPLVSLPPGPPTASAPSLLPLIDLKIDRDPALAEPPFIVINLDASTPSKLSIDELRPADPQVDQHPGRTDSSVQSSVTYAKVLHTSSKQDKLPIQRYYQDGSGSSSSDEGIFLANNIDISEQFPSGLWKLDSCHCADMDDVRRSCSFSSAEELSETSDQEHDGVVRRAQQLHYLTFELPAEDEGSEEEEAETDLLRKNVLNQKNYFVESRPLLALEDSREQSGVLSTSTCGSSPYLPQ
ncbi:leptin receptor [Xenentodon cancila]